MFWQLLILALNHNDLISHIPMLQSASRTLESMSDSEQPSPCPYSPSKRTINQESSRDTLSNDPNPQTPPRPSLALKHRHEANKVLLSLDEKKLLSNIAHRGNHLDELKSCARDLNNGIRDHYAAFIHNVGRNIYPLIIATDHEVDGPCGVGTTLTLYEANGNVTKCSPAHHTNYELYKTCAHTFMGLSVELGPYLANAGICHGDSTDERAQKAPCTRDISWKKSLSEFLQSVRTYRDALVHAVEIEALVRDEDGVNKGSNSTSHATSLELPPLEMRNIMMAMLSTVIGFCESSLTAGMLDVSAWEKLNRDNFPRIKACMKAATKAQADACVKQIVKWRDMLGEEAWRDLYVVIPTVWAVDGENPRKEMFKQLMDAERVQTHIIMSEYPRDHSDARTLLGRVVGDRAIGRFVFGVESLEHQIKVMGLSSEVDVVLDDALPAIWSACEEHGCPIRKH